MLALEVLGAIVRAAWGPDTCDPHDLPDWRSDNPAQPQVSLVGIRPGVMAANPSTSGK